MAGRCILRKPTPGESRTVSDSVRQLKITPETVDGFTLKQRLGQGSTGTVFKANRISSGETFAIKLLFPNLAKLPGFTRNLYGLRKSGPRSTTRTS